MDRQMIDYLPPILREYEEIQQICNVEQYAKEKMWQDLERAFNECHILTQSKAGAERWEKTLGIIPKDTDSLDVRNLRIMAKLHEDLPYTYRTLKKMIASLSGGNDSYILNIDNDNYVVTVKIALKSRELLQAVDELVDRVVPAHMILITELMYNTHKMIQDAGKTHAELALLTHKQIREIPM